MNKHAIRIGLAQLIARDTAIRTVLGLHEPATIPVDRVIAVLSELFDEPLKVQYGDAVERTLVEVERELRRAAGKHPAQNSLHEGYAVLLEEVDEFWDEVKKRSAERSLDNVRLELIQIAAMAVRTCVDVVNPMLEREALRR